MQLPGDFRDFLALCRSEQIEYLLVGGWAVAYHGHPRFTHDLDVWVAATPENAASLVRVLQKFGFAPTSLDPAAFLEPRKIVRLGVPPLQIDILTSVTGVEFAPCYAERIDADVDGVVVSIVSRDRLLENKQASGRAKDLADIEALRG